MSSNYRAIALSSIICKILDTIILNKHHSILSTSDLQFGFKAKHSTTMCTFAVLETIKYYNNRNTNVHIMLLDASQAFDVFNTLNCLKLC